MKPHHLAIVGASCASLAVGYMAGSAGKSAPEPTIAQSEQQSNHSARSSQHSSGTDHQRNEQSGNSLSSSSSRSKNPKQLVRRAEHQLSQSAMSQLDIRGTLEIWEMFEGMSTSELKEALSSMKPGGVMSQSTAMLKMILMGHFAEQDGKGAAEYTLQHEKKGMMRAVSLMSTMGVWMKEDPDAAEAWYTANKDEFKGGMFGQDMIGQMFFRQKAKKDIDAALGNLDLNKTSDRSKAVSAISQIAIEPELREKALNKALATEDVDLRNKMLDGILTTLSYQDQDAAQEVLATLEVEDPERFGEYQKKMLQGLAMHDPEAALEYSMNQIEDENDRTSALSSAFSTYASQESEAAKKWLLDSSVEDKDALIQRATQRLSWQQPEEAMDWALMIEDDDTRTEQAADVYKDWKREHKAGAQNWLDAQDEDTRAAILEEVSEE